MLLNKEADRTIWQSSLDIKTNE